MKKFGKLILVLMVFLSFMCLSGCEQATQAVNQAVDKAGQVVETAKETVDTVTGSKDKPEDEGKNQEAEPAEDEGKEQEREPAGSGKKTE